MFLDRGGAREAIDRHQTRSKTVQTGNSPIPEGALLLVYFASYGEHEWATIEEWHFETQGERLFLVGRVPPNAVTGGWGGGGLMALAWDTVQRYYVFPSREEYRRAGQPDEKKRSWWRRLLG